MSRKVVMIDDTEARIFIPTQYRAVPAFLGTMPEANTDTTGSSFEVVTVAPTDVVRPQGATQFNITDGTLYEQMNDDVDTPEWILKYTFTGTTPPPPPPARFIGINICGPDIAPYLATDPAVTVVAGPQGCTATYGPYQPYNTTGVVNPAPSAVYNTDGYQSGSSQWIINGWTPGADVLVRTHHVSDTPDNPNPRQFTVTATGAATITLADHVFERGDNLVTIYSGTIAADPSGLITLNFQGNASYPGIAAFDLSQ